MTKSVLISSFLPLFCAPAVNHFSFDFSLLKIDPYERLNIISKYESKG